MAVSEEITKKASRKGKKSRNVDFNEQLKKKIVTLIIPHLLLSKLNENMSLALNFNYNIKYRLQCFEKINKYIIIVMHIYIYKLN